MTDAEYFDKLKRSNLIFTEAHLQQGGELNAMTSAGVVNPQPFFRRWGVPQWSHEKGRYLTYEEWYQKQKEAERSAPLATEPHKTWRKVFTETNQPIGHKKKGKQTK